MAIAPASCTATQASRLDAVQVSRVRVHRSYDFIGNTLRGLKTVPMMVASMDSKGAFLKKSGNPAWPWPVIVNGNDRDLDCEFAMSLKFGL
jgi:hypothetical protein